MDFQSFFKDRRTRYQTNSIHLSQRNKSGAACYIRPPKPAFLEVSMVNNLVFRWPKASVFMVLGARDIYIYIYQEHMLTNDYIHVYCFFAIVL